MNLDESESMRSLAAHDHGVLCTIHPQRGVDAVPVVFAVDRDAFLGVPIDLVKPKSSVRLQRESNLEADARATLLVEHWDAADWSRLWWVRAALLWQPDGAGRADALSAELARKYPQYRDEPFAGILVFQIVGLSGWSAAAPVVDGG